MVVDQLSTEQSQQVEEYFRAKNDIIYFIEHFCKIPTPGGNQLI